MNERKRALENFLTRIACHPELSSSPDVELMLHGDDETLNKAKSGQIATGPGAAPSKKGGAAGVWSIFKDVAQTVSTAVYVHLSHISYRYITSSLWMRVAHCSLCGVVNWQLVLQWWRR